MKENMARMPIMARAASTAILVIFLLGCRVSSHLPKTNERPMNVLFIPVDDLNHWVGYFGRNKQSITPNLDRLAAMGVSFSNAHCVAPVCCPSRAATLSGLRPSTTGVYDNSDDWRDAIPVDITLPTFFKKNGYEVLGGGKIYHGSFDRRDEFDFYFKGKADASTQNILKKGQFGGIKWAELNADDSALNDYHVAKWAADELLKKHDKPFFLAPGIFRPHMPWNVPKKYFDLFPLEDIQLPPYLPEDLNDLPEEGIAMANPDQDHLKIQDEKQWKEAIRAYLACIAFADAQIGIILDAYENSPEKNNTMLVLWGDHGWHLGEKHHWRKFSLWEEATRAPLMWIVPGITPKGVVCKRTVDLLSIYPTLAEAARLNLPSHLEGESILTLLKNPEKEWHKPALTTFKEGNHSVRFENYRYIQYKNGGQELYVHPEDPYEWNNLAKQMNKQSWIKTAQSYLPKVEKQAIHPK